MPVGGGDSDALGESGAAAGGAADILGAINNTL
jgi:hypothetical protein